MCDIELCDLLFWIWQLLIDLTHMGIMWNSFVWVGGGHVGGMNILFGIWQFSIHLSHTGIMCNMFVRVGGGNVGGVKK